jgi:dynein intermediate chain
MVMETDVRNMQLMCCYLMFQQLSQPRLDDWSKFVYTLQELKNNQADEEIDKLNLSSSGPSSLGNLASLSPNPLR